MIILQILLVWILVGITSYAWCVIAIYLTAKKHGKGFHYTFNPKATLCTVISWPHFLQETIVKIREAKKLWNEDRWQ